MKIHDTNTPKRATLRLNMDALDKIKQRWPVVAEGRPLAISTGEQIAEALGEDVGDAMARHTGTVTYLTACAAPGAQRVNLDGTDAGRVSIANQNWARRQLKALAKIGGTHAERYLRGRGITCDLPETLRFMPDIFHGPSTSWACATVARVDPTGGVHRTYFDKHGNRLPKNAKLMQGACAGGAVRLSGAEGPLVVAEGIETGLALLSGLLGRPASVWAALSTSGMKSMILPPDPHRMTIATDGDEPGKQAGDALASRAHALGWEVRLLPAPVARDWADVLAAKGGAA
jgi:Toprim domain/ProQ/FINO family